MMTAQNKVTDPTLKISLFLLAAIFALAIIALVIVSTSAATTTGKAPSLAISLADDLNTGILGPDDQRWFKLTPTGQATQVEQALTVFFTPGDGNMARQVSLQLFEESQLPLFYEGDTGSMVNLGAGQSVSRDSNPNSGELFWTGWLLGQQSYYIQIKNSSQTPIDYWLFTKDVSNFAFEEAADTVETEATPAPISQGTSPYAANSLNFNPTVTEPYKGSVVPGQEVWYSLSAGNVDQAYFEQAALTMFATPNDAGQAENLTFEIFTAEEIRHWSTGGSNQLNNIGAGSLVQRDKDPFTAEHFWTGWLVDRDIYYIRIYNGSNLQIDYWLFPGDIYNPELG